jgi:hypothetical protein
MEAAKAAAKMAQEAQAKLEAMKDKAPGGGGGGGEAVTESFAGAVTESFSVGLDTTFHVIQSRTRVMGWHFSPRYYCASKHSSIDDSIT